MILLPKILLITKINPQITPSPKNVSAIRGTQFISHYFHLWFGDLRHMKGNHRSVPFSWQNSLFCPQKLKNRHWNFVAMARQSFTKHKLYDLCAFVLYNGSWLNFLWFQPIYIYIFFFFLYVDIWVLLLEGWRSFSGRKGLEKLDASILLLSWTIEIAWMFRNYTELFAKETWFRVCFL